MVINSIIRFLQLLALGALQVLLFNHIHFEGYGMPMVYVAMLLYVPADANRVGTLCWAFLMGFMMDLFANTGGASAAALTLAAMIQPKLLEVNLPKDALEDMEPTYRSMGTWNHLRYMLILLTIHHLVFFGLESFSFFNISSLLLDATTSFFTSGVVIALMETLRGKKSRANG